MLQFYPDKNSLKEVMSQKLTLSDVKGMCKTNGIFLLASDKECLVNTAHLFFWGYNDINFLADAIDDERNNKKSIRLEIKPKEETQESTYSSLLNQIQKRLNSQKGEERLIIEEVRNTDNDNKKEVLFKYVKHQKGRVRLLDEIEKNFTLLITGNTDNSVVVDVTHDDSADVKIIKNEVQRFIGVNSNLSINQVTLKSLTLQNRVNLFDRFFGYTFDNWRTDEIKSIKLVKDEQLFEANEAEEGESIDNSILSGINSALLKGTALRTNVFVQNSLDRGYYFSQATIRLEHKIESIKISIDIIFRGDDRLLEVNVSGSYETEDGIDLKKTLPVNEQRKYLRYFHDIISEVYSQLLLDQANNI